MQTSQRYFALPPLVTTSATINRTMNATPMMTGSFFDFIWPVERSCPSSGIFHNGSERAVALTTAPVRRESAEVVLSGGGPLHPDLHERPPAARAQCRR